MILPAVVLTLWLAVAITRPVPAPFAGEQGDLLLAHERRRHGYVTLLATILTLILLWVAFVHVATFNSDLSRLRGEGCLRNDYCWTLDKDNHWHIAQT